MLPEEAFASKVEDLLGIWKGLHHGHVAYIQFEADGTLKCAHTVEQLHNSSGLIFSGRVWFEEGILTVTESLEPRPGAYKVQVHKRHGKTVYLSFHVIEDSSRGRPRDLGRRMTRVEP